MHLIVSISETSYLIKRNDMATKQRDWHRADIVAALKKRGWSVRALSQAAGLSPNTLATALQCPYLKGEQIIAKALDMQANEIWPTRYAARNLKPSLTELSK